MKSFLNKIKDVGQSVSPEVKFKIALKDKLMVATKSSEAVSWAAFHNRRLIYRIKRLAKEVKPSSYFRAKVKERILDWIETKERRGWAYGLFHFIGKKRAWALITVCTFVFVLFLPVIEQDYEVFAAPSAYLHIEEGENISVKRGEETTTLSGGDFALEEGDVVITGDDTLASIRFFDDSISRMDANTTLEISKLFVGPEKKMKTVVAVTLDVGRVWSKIVTLVGDVSRFHMNTDGLVVTVKKKGAFDIEKKPEGIKVVAADNSVDVNVVRSESEVLSKTLVKGYSVEVTQKDIEIKTDEKSDQWALDNLKKDKEYTEEIEKRAEDTVKEKAGMLPNNPLYSIVKELPEKTKLALTFNEVEKERVKLKQAGKRLLEAEALILDDKKDDAKEKLQEFQKVIQEVVFKVVEFEDAGLEEGIVLRADVRDHILALKKLLSPSTPGSKMYEVKEWLYKVEIDLAKDEMEKNEIKYEMAAGLLLDVQNLIDKEDYDYVQPALEKYQVYAQELTSDLKRLSEDESKGEVAVVVLGKLQADLGSLVAIQEGIGLIEGIDEDVVDLDIIIPEEPSLVDTEGLQESVNEAGDQVVKNMGVVLEELDYSRPKRVLETRLGVMEKNIVDMEVLEGLEDDISAVAEHERVKIETVEIEIIELQPAPIVDDKPLDISPSEPVLPAVEVVPRVPVVPDEALIDKNIEVVSDENVLPVIDETGDNIYPVQGDDTDVEIVPSLKDEILPKEPELEIKDSLEMKKTREVRRPKLFR